MVKLSALGGIIWEIKTVAASSFISVTFNHCYRSCNCVMHELPIIVSVVVYNLVICVVESLLSCRADGLMEWNYSAQKKSASASSGSLWGQNANDAPSANAYTWSFISINLLFWEQVQILKLIWAEILVCIPPNSMEIYHEDTVTELCLAQVISS